METLGQANLDDSEISETELVTLAFGRMMADRGPFENPVVASLTDRITRNENAQSQYTMQLETEIKKNTTIAGLQKLKRNYEQVSGKKLNKEHSLYPLYENKMQEIIASLSE